MFCEETVHPISSHLSKCNPLFEVNIPVTHNNVNFINLQFRTKQIPHTKMSEAAVVEAVEAKTTQKVKVNYLPGFRRLSQQVYVHDGDSTLAAQSPTSATDPTTVIIYGWGDASPKHVSKYVEGYWALFPGCRIVLILSPILKALYQTPAARDKSMQPVLDALFGRATAFGSADGKDGSERVLIHVMSNTGGISYASTIKRYMVTKTETDPALFPHKMVVLDSTPGNSSFFTNIVPWSRAMALGLAPRLPLPFVVTQFIAGLFLGGLHLFGFVIGASSTAESSTRAVNNPELADNTAKRLYLYSKEDDIIMWYQIEEHVAECRQNGWKHVEVEVFKGTPHVGHMRGHPEQYWGAIKRNWEA